MDFQGLFLKKTKNPRFSDQFSNPGRHHSINIYRHIFISRDLSVIQWRFWSQKSGAAVLHSETRGTGWFLVTLVSPIKLSNG